MTSYLDHALACAAQGWPVFPCLPETKRPLVAGGFKAATTTPEQIRAWWAQHPTAWVGLSPGPLGVVVVDIDVKNGKVGAASWAACLEKHGPTPDTYTVRTASGGLHQYFAGRAPSTQDVLGKDIDTRGEGGYVIAYPDVLSRAPIAPAPAWVLAALAPSARRALVTAPDADVAKFVVPDGDRKALTRADLLAFSKTAPTEQANDALAVLAGKPWGRKGGRDPSLSNLCVFLARDFPWLDPETSSELWAASCAAVEAEDNATTTTDWVAKKLRHKLTVNAGRAAAKAAEADANAPIVAWYKARAEATPVPAVADPAEPGAPEAMGNDWVVGTPQGYFLKRDEGYEGPYPAELLPARARDTLGAAPLVLHTWVRNELKPKPAPALLHEYGRVPRATEFTLTGPTRLENDLFMYNALREVELEPEYNAEIAKWLELLAGPLTEPFLDWLATFRRFERPTCAVMLRAWPGVGKGLFIDGLARLFAGKAVPFVEAISSFNGALCHCPIVVADEALSAPPGVNAVDEFKKLVGDSSFRVADKHVRATTLTGCLRVVLTSNHNGGFKIVRELTEADVAALEQRVLLLSPAKETADYLVGLGGRDHTEAWVAGGGLARHVRWLETTRQVVVGGRFLVEGRGGMSELLSGESSGTAPVLRACVAAILRGNAAVVLKDDGQYWVGKKRLTEEWDTLNNREPKPLDMGASWGLICTSSPSKVFKEEKHSVRRSPLKWELLLRCAERLGLEEELQQRRLGS